MLSNKIKLYFGVFFIFSYLPLLSYAAYGKSIKKVSKNSKVRKVANIETSVKKEKAVKGYLKCSELDISLVRKKECVNKYLLPSLSKSRKDRFVSWPTMFNTNLIEFKTCSNQRKKEVAHFPLVTIDYICVNIEVGGQVKEVTFFFKPSSDTSKLFSIYY